MLEKLKDLSSAIVLPAIILYSFGFICITSYLARFDIVTFDIINSRFLLAGFFPLISLSVVIIVAWNIYRFIPDLQFLIGATHWYSRYRLYAISLVAVWTASQILSAFLNLGKYSPPSPEILPFSAPLGRFDVVGKFATAIPHVLPNDITWIIQLALYFLGYLLIIALIILLIIPVLIKVLKNRPQTAQKTTETPEIGHPSTQGGEPVLAFKILIALFDVTFFSFVISVFFWCFYKLNSSKIDFNSFGQPFDLSEILVFCWLYSTVGTLLIFFGWGRIEPQQLSLSFKRLFVTNDPLMIPVTFQQIVIPILLSLFVFGMTIFPRISFSVGGGAPREVLIRTKNQPDFLEERHMYLIGESSQFLFLVDISSSLALCR